ncbi:DUF7288 family protein [Salinigranum salinum]|uniref:DUF7288 family protein n=1 Tax=Salinigranum salinum TaxID=1364937 RepID=UPI001260A27D|nr:hypothetical protein [Salinigranum salinum]
MDDDARGTGDAGRGQAHTLEAFAAATILLASIVFALQVTAVTPLTASTSSQHIENQQEAVATGVLAAAAENGTLEPTLLAVNNSTGRFHGNTFEGTFVAGGPPTALGETLNETFLDRGIAFNLYVHHTTSERTVRRQTIVRMGGPSDNAISARWLVTLYDDDVLYAADGTETTHTLENSTTFYAADRHPGPLYNVLEVEVVVWRM